MKAIWIVILAHLIALCSGVELFVSLVGNGGECNSTAPCQSLQQAINQFYSLGLAEDFTVYIAPGQYTSKENINITLPNNSTLNNLKLWKFENGNASLPVIFDGENKFPYCILSTNSLSLLNINLANCQVGIYQRSLNSSLNVFLSSISSSNNTIIFTGITLNVSQTLLQDASLTVIDSPIAVVNFEDTIFSLTNSSYLYSGNQLTVTFLRCIFDSGAAFWIGNNDSLIENADVSMIDSSFITTKGDYDDANFVPLFLSGGNVTLVNVSFESFCNRAVMMRDGTSFTATNVTLSNKVSNGFDIIADTVVVSSCLCYVMNEGIQVTSPSILIEHSQFIGVVHMVIGIYPVPVSSFAIEFQLTDSYFENSNILNYFGAYGAFQGNFTGTISDCQFKDMYNGIIHSQSGNWNFRNIQVSGASRTMFALSEGADQKNWVLVSNCSFANGPLVFDLQQFENVTIDKCSFSYLSDSAISLSEIAEVTLSSSQFSNIVSYSGAGITMVDTERINIDSCSYTDTYSDFGGGLYVSANDASANLNISSSWFNGNNGSSIYMVSYGNQVITLNANNVQFDNFAPYAIDCSTPVYGNQMIVFPDSDAIVVNGTSQADIVTEGIASTCELVGAPTEKHLFLWITLGITAGCLGISVLVVLIYLFIQVQRKREVTSMYATIQ